MTSTLHLLGRHQLGALAATAVDFFVMTLLVTTGAAGAVVATAVGATLGAITNFLLGRTWIFRASHGAPGPQILRYAAVSGASAGWNALGEYALHDRLGMQFFVARLVVSVVVSLAWNFPLQRAFVFRAPAARVAS